jgi:hypothetical protein
VFTGSRKKGDEMRGKAIKVVDLLQHSAELGNMDALYTLAQISLVRVRFVNAGLVSKAMNSFPQLRPFPPTQPSHSTPSSLTLKSLAMPLHNPSLPSFTQRVIVISSPSTKQKPNYTTHSLDMVATKELRWL